LTLAQKQLRFFPGVGKVNLPGMEGFDPRPKTAAKVNLPGMEGTLAQKQLRK
jgi:hypothetical protein